METVILVLTAINTVGIGLGVLAFSKIVIAASKMKSMFGGKR